MIHPLLGFFFSFSHMFNRAGDNPPLVFVFVDNQKKETT